MVQQDEEENNSPGCATEVLEGSAYQSWDWRNGAEVGQTFNEVVPKSAQPWASGLQAGDSLWHQTVWDCRTRVDTIGQYDIATLHELDWIWLRPGTWLDGFVLEEWRWNKVYSNNADVMKIAEANRFVLTTFEEDGLIFADPSWLHTKAPHVDSVKFIEHTRIVFTRNFNEGFFKLVEEPWLDATIPYWDGFVLTDFDFLKAKPYQSDLLVLGEAWKTKGWKKLFDILKMNEVLAKVGTIPLTSEIFKMEDSDYIKTYLNNLDRMVLIELLRIVFTRNFNEGFFKLVESLNFGMTALKLDNIKIVENIQNFLEVGFTDALKIYEVLALETVTAVAEIFKLSDSSFLETHSNNGDNGKLVEIISLNIFSGGYGIGGYGVLGYGV